MIQNLQQGFSVQKDVGLDANVRPNALNVRGQQPNLYPFDAFQFNDPNTVDKPKLGMAPGWSFDVGTIYLDDLETNLGEAINSSFLGVEDLRNEIKKVDRGLNLTSQTVFENGVEATASIELLTGVTEENRTDIDSNTDDIVTIFAEVALKAEIRDSVGDPISGAFITLNASYIPGGAANSYIELIADQIRFTGGSGETLDGVLVDDGTEVYLKGNLRIDSDDNNRFIDLGDKGILAKDSAGTIVHDIADAPLVTGATACGHLYFVNANDTANRLVDTLSFNLNQWYTTGTVSAGNTNIKAVLLQIRLFINGTGTNFCRIFFRPKGSSWTNGTNYPIPFLESGYNSSTESSIAAQITVPVGTNGEIEYYILSNSKTTGQIRIMQAGYYV